LLLIATPLSTFGIPNRPIITFARLGDQNLKDPNDADPKDYDIGKVIMHPQYSSGTKENDIALLKLKEKVKFVFEFIRPACLQQPGESFNASLIAVSFMISAIITMQLTFTFVDWLGPDRNRKALR